MSGVRIVYRGVYALAATPILLSHESRRAAQGYTQWVRRTWAAFSLVTFLLAAQEKTK